MSIEVEEIKLDWSDWHDTYIPKVDEHGDLVDCMHDYPEELKKAIEENRCWTLVDCGDDCVIVNGAAYVNRMDYYITEKPFADHEQIEVD